jgi:hypothetical protein
MCQTRTLATPEAAATALLPRQRGLEPLHFRFGEGQGKGGTHAKVDADARFLNHALGQLAVQPHPLLGDFREGPRDAEAAHRAQPAIRVARGMAADGVALDDHAGNARLREVVGGDHAHDAAAHGR